MARGTRECGTTRGGCGKDATGSERTSSWETRRPGKPRQLLLAADEEVGEAGERRYKTARREEMDNGTERNRRQGVA